MKKKTGIIALIIVCLVMIGGLVVGLVVGPSYETELKERYVITLTAGHVPFEQELLEAAVADAGPPNAHVRMGGTAIGDKATISYEGRFDKIEALTKALQENYPNVEVADPDLLSAAKNVQPFLIQALIPCAALLLIALIYGMMRYGTGGGLQLLAGLLVDMALPLSLAVLIRLPLSYGFAGIVGLIGVISLLLRTDYLNRLTAARRNLGKKQSDDTVATDVLRAGKPRILLIVLGISALLAAVMLLGQSPQLNDFLIFAVLGMATLLVGQMLSPVYYEIFERR